MRYIKRLINIFLILLCLFIYLGMLVISAKIVRTSFELGYIQNVLDYIERQEEPLDEGLNLKYNQYMEKKMEIVNSKDYIEKWFSQISIFAKAIVTIIAISLILFEIFFFIIIFFLWIRRR